MFCLQLESTFRYVRHMIRRKDYTPQMAKTTLYGTPMIYLCLYRRTKAVSTSWLPRSHSYEFAPQVSRKYEWRYYGSNVRLLFAPLTHGHAHFFWVGFMMRFGKPKLFTKFEVASFSRCKNIKGEPRILGNFPTCSANFLIFYCRVYFILLYMKPHRLGVIQRWLNVVKFSMVSLTIKFEWWLIAEICRVAQLKWGQLTFLMVTFECIVKNR